MRTDFSELRSRYEALKKEREQLEERVALVRAQQLLSDIKNAGEYDIDRSQRDILAGLATDLGAMIYDISGSYPSTILRQLPQRLNWLHKIGFRRDPFLYTNGETDPYLQEYFYFGMRHFLSVFDVSGPGTIFVFGPPGSGKSSMRNVISQLCRTENIFPVVYQDFGSMVHKCQRGEVVQAEDHAAQILKRALETLARLADEKVISLPTEINDRDRIIRNQLGLYVSEYEDDLLRRQTFENFLKPAQETTVKLPDDARERLGRFCRYVTELFGYQFVYILVDHEDDIAPDEDIAWQVLEPLLSTRRLLELSGDKLAFKFFLGQKFRERALQIPWIKQEWSSRGYQLEWPDEELRALLRVRLMQCSEGRYRSLGELSEVGNLDNSVIQLSLGSPRKLIAICNRLFSEHGRRWSPEDGEPLLITFQEVDEVLKPFTDWRRESALEPLIAQGESKLLEFKPAMRFNRSAGNADKEMEREVARTICAFMNTEGGTLIIGVDYDGTARGLNDDFSTLGRRKNKDGFEQAFVRITENLFDTPLLSNYYEAYFMEYREKLVYVVQVKRSETPVFCNFDNTREFYVRKLTTVRKLDAKETWDYASRRFR